MIGRKAHPRYPDDPMRCVFVPLIYDRETGECVPILGPEGSKETELAAARVCFDELLRDWHAIAKLSRQVRAFCEHPNFVGFEADGIDAEMITSSARLLAEAIELSTHNVLRLFDPPGDSDEIRVGDMVYELDPETGFMVAVRALESDQETKSPDTLLSFYIRMSVRKVYDLLRRPISRRGLEHGIDELILMLPEDDDEDESTEREPSQSIADHRFARYLVTAIKKAEKRTGRRVSARGFTAMIGVLERLLERGEGDDDQGGGGEPGAREPGPPDVGGVVLREIDDGAPGEPAPDPGNGSDDGRSGSDNT